MSDLQSHLSALEGHIDELPTDTPTWVSVVDAMGEIYFLLDELATIARDNTAIYDK